MDKPKSSKIKLAGKNGESDVDLETWSDFSANKKLMDEVEKVKKEHSMHKDFSVDMKNLQIDLEKKGKFLEKNFLQKGHVTQLKNWSRANPSLILEVADNGKFKLFERKDQYDDPGSIHVAKDKIEFAEDDRVLGIPYAQAMAGDRVYIVNGKIFTGWALYFSLSSIKSPEDYARNVDLVYNIPYLYASLLLKAQLGLGCGININYGAESTEVPEEKLIERYLFDRLKINTQKLIKTGFHLGLYGNSYWALRRGKDNIVDKVTILQPERLKIFLDPMTTKILFYIYLPPIIGGTTIASYPDDGRVNPNILAGVTLSYPTPIVMHPEDVIHFKINDFTEYPFGFSDVKSCIDPATARLDINILAPILFKKYTKPMIHWQLNTEGIGPTQVKAKQDEMISLLQDMEPGSDPVTTDRWKATVITVGQGKEDILALTSDIDTQIFAATGAPESYFKPKGSTDRMISEQDKTFLARLKVPQTIVSDEIEDKLIKPRIYYEIQKKAQVDALLEETDIIEEYLKSFDSWLASEPKFPKVEWKEVFKQDETQSIANSIALLNARVIDAERAAMKIGEIPIIKQRLEDMNKISIMPLSKEEAPIPKEEETTPKDYNEQENMENLRGGLNVNPNAAAVNRNEVGVKDPSQLGGSRYAQHELKGKEADIKEKHNPKPTEAKKNGI